MFPANFIRVVVPLSKSSISQQRQQAGAQTVTALYPFAAETWDDLELKVSVACGSSSAWIGTYFLGCIEKTMVITSYYIL